MEYSERDLVIRCIQNIERKFFPDLAAEGARLKQRDLEYLMELMEEQSGIKISLSTMKRIWKADFNKLPHTHTLNALVSLLDYDSWGDFRQSNQVNTLPVGSSRKWRGLQVSLMIVGMVAVLWIIYSLTSKPTSIHIPANVPFSANNTVVNGVPNTVIFSYDLNGVKADSFFIQRSWNPTNKVQIDPRKQYFSETYYYPGFHWARLIANETTLQKKRILIRTDGWLATAKPERLEPIPVYMNQESLIQKGSMRISNTHFEKVGFDPKKGLVLSFFNIREFQGLLSEQFILETRLKIEETQTLICPYAEIRIIDEMDASWLTITDNGCVGNLFLKVGDSILKATENDFSKMGTTMSEWQNIKLVSHDGVLRYYLNEELVLETPFKDAEGKIMGVVLTFNGRAAIDYFRLKNLGGKMLYTDEFEN